MNQRIENYKYDDAADPEVALKTKGLWIKENKMKCIVPQLGLRFYFEESDKGAYQIVDGKLISIVDGVATGIKENKMIIKWTNRFGSICYFLEGFNPNLVDPDASWINEAKENKMTREEAVKKHTEVTGWSKASSEMYIKGLEVLGLIKFEEEFTILYRMHPLTIRQKGSRTEVLNNDIMVYAVDHR